MWTDLLVIRLLLLALGVIKPLEELSSRLANLLASGQVDILLASFAAPSLENLLRDKIVVVVLHEDGRHLRDEVRLVVADEALSATQESLFVLLGRDHLLQHGGARINLLDHVVIEDGLGKDGEGPVLALDAELLSLEVDLYILYLADAALGLGRLLNPATELIVCVRSISTLIIITDNKGTLEVIRKILGTGLNSLLRGVNRPLNLLGLDLFDVLGLSVDAAGELIITASLKFKIAVLFAVVGAAITVAAATSILNFLAVRFLGPAFGLLGGLVLLALLRLVLQDEGAELEAEVYISALTTSLAVKEDAAILDVDLGLRVLALLAEDELGDEAVQVVLELGGLVSAVDDPTVVAGVVVGLSAELEAEVLDDIWGRDQRPAMQEVGV